MWGVQRAQSLGSGFQRRHHRGSQRDIILRPAEATLLSRATPQMKSPFLSAASHSDNSKDRRLRILQKAEKSFYPNQQAG